MNARTLRDFTLTAEETRIVREALLQYIIENGKASNHLRRANANRMAESISVDIRTATSILKIIDPD